MTKIKNVIFFDFVKKKKLLPFDQKIKRSQVEAQNSSIWVKLKTYYKAGLANAASNFKSSLFPFHYHFTECHIFGDYVLTEHSTLPKIHHLTPSYVLNAKKKGNN